jgi:hypothetical protein
MTKFEKKDINQMTWEEAVGLIDILVSKISDHFPQGEGINVMSPLLRTGGIVGGMLAIKMRVLTMLPVQFKYFYNPTVIKQMISIPDILTDIPEPMNILLCEGNTSSGSIATKAAAAVKEKYPQAKIYLATLTKMYGGPETLEGIEHIFYGRMTDENLNASEEEKKNFDLRPGIVVFPWENVEDELLDINAI